MTGPGLVRCRTVSLAVEHGYVTVADERAAHRRVARAVAGHGRTRLLRLRRDPVPDAPARAGARDPVRDARTPAPDGTGVAGPGRCSRRDPRL